LMGLLMLLIIRRMRSTARLSEPLEALRDFLKESHRRLEIISPHAHDYFNSLGGDGARTYAHLTRVLAGIEQRVEEVEELIAIGSKPAISEAVELLGSNFTFQVGTMSSVIGEERFPDLPVDRIEMTVEKLFQDLGKRIATASFSAGLQKITTRKQRKDTFHSLHQANIHIPEEDMPDDDLEEESEDDNEES